jgi:hypothetical protein
MELPTAGRSGIGYYALLIVLAIAVAVGVVLLARLITGPPGATFLVGSPQGVQCPAGEGTPACFEFEVTNVGRSSSHVRCEVTAAPDTTAVFLNQSPVYVSTGPVLADSSISLFTKVDIEGSGIVGAPALRCEGTSVADYSV